ncbi:carbamoyltransferase [Pseudodesulfovibrio sp. zrk46]|uniref:carbamoyltransferase family protein n=1 Tax=Pseudodesulfovibrio sp. zrk46 TaxID=2725288 RepID=UPI00144979B1|nr:carbamoyltransferase [Pseudodesulfovibrio sp. zrk46]QJB57274.1 carbamoyltransferase [Pseudodesulfovibrio sp. zrk46]
MSDAILGISAFYHDSAAVLMVDGEIVAAAQEERFTRKKHDSDFPHHAAKYVLKEGGLSLSDLTAVAFYDKPYLKFERLLESYNGFAPKGLRSFLSAIPVWIKEKLFMRKMLNDELARLGEGKPQILFPEHHLSHAASAFYPSPFEEAAILTVDGVGEWATTTIGKGSGKDITILKELHFPHSLGLLYSAFTAFCGFRVNSGEYKLMGLAPYGNPGAKRIQTWKKAIYDELIDVREDGSMLLNMAYFNYATGLTMCHFDRWEKLFGISARQPESDISQDYMDLALAIQQVTEEIVFTLAETAKELTGCDNLVMAGGVALNCVANGKLLRKGTFKDIWIQPAAGDAGGALGAALTGRHIWQGKERTVNPKDSMRGAYLGPEFTENDILRGVRKFEAPFRKYDDFQQLTSDVAKLLTEGNAIGWFQGRMEYGPRALGGRSILGDPRHPEMQKKLNLKIKYREGFRPFAPSVMEEEITTWFDLDRPSPYMLIVAPVADKQCNPLPEGYDEMEMYDRLYVQRSTIPAVTHVDYSARIQSVSKDTNPRYWGLIDTFNREHGCGLVVNTSFNVRGEPIVCTPYDAYACFMRTEMDYLVLGDYLFTKTEQPSWTEEGDWRDQFELD